MRLTIKRTCDFDDFWDYCYGLLHYAADKAEDCKDISDLPMWNKNMVLAYAATSWNDHKVHDWNDEWKEDSLSVATEKVSNMRKTISGLRRKLSNAKRSIQKLKTKKGAKA